MADMIRLRSSPERSFADSWRAAGLASFTPSASFEAAALPMAEAARRLGFRMLLRLLRLGDADLASHGPTSAPSPSFKLRVAAGGGQLHEEPRPEPEDPRDRAARRPKPLSFAPNPLQFPPGRRCARPQARRATANSVPR